MAEKAKVWARATDRGQRPDNRRIVGPDDDPFQVTEAQLKGAKWLQRLKPEEAEKLQARLDAERKAQAEANPSAADLQAKLAEQADTLAAMQAAAEKGKARIAELEAEVAALRKPPAKPASKASDPGKAS